jgi:flagellar basal body-associated protein FliL
MENLIPNGNSEKTSKSLIIVLAIAISFLVWGLFIFFSVGDKGSPPWDFGIVQDIPGESAYSTHPPQAPEPEPQHVSQKPTRVESEVSKEKP